MSLAMKWLEIKFLPWKYAKGNASFEQSSGSALSLSPPEKFKQLVGAAISLDKIDFFYTKNIKLIDQVSLSVKPGEFLALLGPSGCGKTSLLRLIAGLNQANNGLITIDQKPAADSKNELTMVFQNGALFPWLRAIDNIIFALQSQNLSKDENIQQAKMLLSIVGLEKHFSKYPGELSGGQQQRVALARALAYRPRLILMDEPFSALDSLTREALQQDVASILSQMGISVILVTHDIREAVFMADRVLVLSRSGGEIIQECIIDTPRLERADSFRYTAEFSSARAIIWQALHERSNPISIIKKA